VQTIDADLLELVGDEDLHRYSNPERLEAIR
jgi:hypothetical protein